MGAGKFVTGRITAWKKPSRLLVDYQLVISHLVAFKNRRAICDTMMVRRTR
ncbi:MAG: hypothetical protein ACI915_001133 [Gammaproteobacteria bacterium]|jgi:hypothetical protein